MIKKPFLTIFLLSVCAIAAQAQTPNPEQSIAKVRDQFSDIKNRSIELERMKRESDKRSVSESFQLNFTMIKEDFERIQKINNEVQGLFVADGRANFEAALKFVSEINHRAVRLNSNLFTADADGKKETKNKPQIQDQNVIKRLFVDLDKAINTLVHNSIFQNINLVNSDDSLKAQKDLETVIILSNKIKVSLKNQSKNSFNK